MPSEFFVGLEIDHRPTIRLLEGEIDYTLDEQAVRIAPRNRRFTTTSALARGLACGIEDRMREGSVHAFRSGSDLFCSSTQYATVNGRETLDRGQIAIQWDARENGVYQRPETRAGRPVRRVWQLDDFHRRELQVRDSIAGVFRRLRHRSH